MHGREVKQSDIVRLRAAGWTFKEIGKELGISPATASNYCPALFAGIDDKALGDLADNPQTPDKALKFIEGRREKRRQTYRKKVAYVKRKKVRARLIRRIAREDFIHALRLDAIGDIIECPDADPLDVVLAKEKSEALAEIIGDKDEQDLSRLNEETLRHIQHRCSAMGLLPTGIQGDWAAGL